MPMYDGPIPIFEVTDHDHGMLTSSGGDRPGHLGPQPARLQLRIGEGVIELRGSLANLRRLAWVIMDEVTET